MVRRIVLVARDGQIGAGPRGGNRLPPYAIAFPSANTPPVGPPGGSRTPQRTLAAPFSTERGALGPPTHRRGAAVEADVSEEELLPVERDTVWDAHEPHGPARPRGADRLRHRVLPARARPVPLAARISF